MFESLKELWEKHGFDILLIISVVFLLVYALSRMGKRGVMQQEFTYPLPRLQSTKEISQGTAKVKLFVETF